LAPFPATASAEGRLIKGGPFPATVWAEGGQFNGPPSPSRGEGAKYLVCTSSLEYLLGESILGSSSRTNGMQLEEIHALLCFIAHIGSLYVLYVPGVSPILQEECVQKNRVRELWQQGKPAVQGWCSTGNPYIAEMMGHAGFDAVIGNLQNISRRSALSTCSRGTLQAMAEDLCIGRQARAAVTEILSTPLRAQGER
jgi:hypothetical protein